MRHIVKAADSRAIECIQGFIDAQMQARSAGTPWDVVEVDYGSFTRTGQLRSILIQEQKGLCAYTGAPLDERLIGQARSDQTCSFSAHIEHLKSQRQCREELETAGGVVGRDVGEDLAYANMVAALEVRGIQAEHFGAVCREDSPLPVVPTNPDCPSAFTYLDNGSIYGNDPNAVSTIGLLKLDHETLARWRVATIEGFFPQGKHTSRQDLETAIRAFEDEGRLQLYEFSFVLAQVARAYLQIQDAQIGNRRPA